MTDRRATAYGPSTISSQPKSGSRKWRGGTISLTPAETRVLGLLPTYRTLEAIGTQLGIGRPTVKTHVEHIYKKLGATTRAEAVNRAESAGLLPQP
jgi:LuxR family maltose regulon positive regulatory protein